MQRGKGYGSLWQVHDAMRIALCDLWLDKDTCHADNLQTALRKLTRECPAVLFHSSCKMQSETSLAGSVVWPDWRFGLISSCALQLMSRVQCPLSRVRVCLAGLLCNAHKSACLTAESTHKAGRQMACSLQC